MITQNKEKKKKAGFSLVEIMVVIVIIGLLGALVGANVMGNLAEANITAAQNMIRQLEGNVNDYRGRTKKFPTKAQGLKALTEPVGLSKTAIRKSLPNDPWGNPYIYTPPQGKEEFIIRTYGADGVKGGEGEDADHDNISIRKNGEDGDEK